MAKNLIAFYSRADENYVSGMLKNLTIGNTEVAAGILQPVSYTHLLKKDGKVVVNNHEMMPMPVIMGKADYSPDIIKEMQDNCKDVTVVNATEEAVKLGNGKDVYKRQEYS